MIASSLIIENTNKTPAWVRVRDWVLSALVWALYFYMIREVFIDLYVLFHESFDWMFDGTGRPSVPEISRLLSTLRVYAV